MNHADARYLEAKRTVDDRALAPRVRDRLRSELPAEPHVLEAGVGTGTTIPRLLEWGITARRYRGVDRSGDLLEYAREHRTAELDAEPSRDGFRVDDLTIVFEQGDALSVFGEEQADLLVAQAFLDVVPLPEALSVFERALRPGGLLYAPITFDGGTYFQPDHPADDSIEAAYHDHIDGQPGRDARAGRHLLNQCRERDGDLLAIESSDWIVYPSDETYPADERYFLDTILGFVEDAIGNHPDADDWLNARRRHLAAGELSYVAHQYDVLYRTA